MKINITELPTNEADKSASYMVVDWINEPDGTIQGNLFDANGNIVSRHRCYSYEDKHKNTPFELTESQKAYLRGDEPDDKWGAGLVGQWLDKRNIERPKEATAGDLLKLVPRVEAVEK